jgi:flagellar hook protein FlgE
MSFDIALSGIQAINEALDQTSHNIANAGTYGYKSGRANFSALVAGDHPAGTAIGSVSQNIGLSGGVLNTGRSLDASINGRGFFVTRTASNEIQYTRVGIFDTSNNGYLIDASGRTVQGYALTPPSTVLGALGDIKIPQGQIPAVASTKAGYVGNMSADWKVPTVATFQDVNANPVTAATPPDPLCYNMSQSSVVYDTLGTQHTLTQYFAAAGGGVVNVYYTLDGNDTATPTQLGFNPANGQMNAVAGAAVPPAPGTFSVTLPTPVAGTLATLNPIVVDYTGSTFFAGKATTTVSTTDGYASGVFSNVELAKDGSVIAKYSNGQSQTVAMIALATFPDEAALTAVNDTSWTASIGSGSALTSTAGTGLTGTLNTSSLEQSNVDITSELVGLMTSQRNYQANSKVIQTESTMMQSLMQAI